MAAEDVAYTWCEAQARGFKRPLRFTMHARHRYHERIDKRATLNEMMRWLEQAQIDSFDMDASYWIINGIVFITTKSGEVTTVMTELQWRR